MDSVSPLVSPHVLERVFGFLPCLADISRVFVVNKCWNGIIRNGVYKSLERQRWMYAFLNSYMSGKNWMDIDWEKEFRWMCVSRVKIPKEPGFVDQYGNFFASDKRTLYRNNVAISNTGYVLNEKPFFAVDVVTHHLVISVASNPFNGNGSKIIRMDPFGNVLHEMALPPLSECCGIAVFGRYIYALLSAPSEKRKLFVKIDSHNSSVVEHRKLSQLNTCELVGISGNGEKIFLWDKISAEKSSFITLDTTGKKLKTWNLKKNLVLVTTDKNGVWYFFYFSELKLQFGVWLLNGEIHQSLLVGIDLNPVYEILYQAKIHEVSGNIMLVTKRWQQSTYMECEIQQLDWTGSENHMPMSALMH